MANSSRTDWDLGDNRSCDKSNVNATDDESSEEVKLTCNIIMIDIERMGSVSYFQHKQFDYADHFVFFL